MVEWKRQKLEVAVMFKEKKDEKIKYLVGNKEIFSKPIVPYDNLVCNFLSQLSIRLLKIKEIKHYPDIQTLAFWCREKNILNLKKNYFSNKLRLGLGLIFHITPSNIPTNFAYSLIFGLITGNSNIVKVPSKKFRQIDIICKVLKTLLMNKKFNKIKKMITIIQYSQNDSYTKKISSICDARLIWGGNETINNIREFKTQERAIDIAFADRYSFSIIKSEEVLKMGKYETQQLVTRFYNDSFLVDQNACSSPRLVIWIGKSINEARNKFWKNLNTIVEKKYNLPDIASVDKFNQLCRDIIEKPYIEGYEKFHNNIYTVKLKNLDRNSDNIKAMWGFFYEYSTSNLNKISKFINKKYQTLTYFGVSKEIIKKFIIKNSLPGIDRVVPIGQALEISLNWDGYDLNNSLSRVIDIK